jgi:uncharacterized membrane protein YdjX (TVP38/TMEM64 family)
MTPSRRTTRLVLLLGACAALVVLATSDAAHALLERLLAWGAAVIAPRPVAGALVFVLLSAASPMLAFLSTAILVPVALASWGRALTIALLYGGWLLGGLAAYGLARAVGRPLVRAVVDEETLARYAGRLTRRARFPFVLLLQLALPSEIPGWLLGLARVRLAVYVAALAVAELPYAVGTVLLAEGVIARRALLLVALGAGGAALLLVALRRLEDRVGSVSRSDRRAPGTPP